MAGPNALLMEPSVDRKRSAEELNVGHFDNPPNPLGATSPIAEMAKEAASKAQPAEIKVVLSEETIERISKRVAVIVQAKHGDALMREVAFYLGRSCRVIRPQSGDLIVVKFDNGYVSKEQSAMVTAKVREILAKAGHDEKVQIAVIGKGMTIVRMSDCYVCRVNSGGQKQIESKKLSDDQIATLREKMTERWTQCAICDALRGVESMSVKIGQSFFQCHTFKVGHVHGIVQSLEGMLEPVGVPWKEMELGSQFEAKLKLADREICFQAVVSKTVGACYFWESNGPFTLTDHPCPAPAEPFQGCHPDLTDPRVVATAEAVDAAALEAARLAAYDAQRSHL